VDGHSTHRSRFWPSLGASGVAPDTGRLQGTYQAHPLSECRPSVRNPDLQISGATPSLAKNRTLRTDLPKVSYYADATA